LLCEGGPEAVRWVEGAEPLPPVQTKSPGGHERPAIIINNSQLRDKVKEVWSTRLVPIHLAATTCVHLRSAIQVYSFPE
ncbi:MAG TPA: hypothetical protein VJ728_00225, partial [Candidatus Binataceae bacterium]|nr:hypothetical protein [Candidatus Binataceae bacterium]